MRTKIQSILLFYLLTQSISLNILAEPLDEGLLKLKKFYKIYPYTYLHSPDAKDKNKCKKFIEPFYGIRTDKKYVVSPTAMAAEGITAVINNNIELARDCANELLNIREKQKDAIFFPFDFDFVPYMPYNLRAKWVSAISQGLALGLFSYLYLKTGEISYKSIADEIFNSYKFDIKDGGFTRYYKGSALFEEYPASTEIAVFNGAAVASLALYDYYIISGNKNAYTLFNNYIKWLEKNISRYDVYDPEYNITLSAYSLAKKRKEILLRFAGDGIFTISDIYISGYNQSKIKRLYHLTVGDKNDEDRSRDIFIFSADKYTNWSEPSKEGRYINKIKGIYDHSPFYFLFKDGYDGFIVRVKYKRESKDKTVKLQFYNGKEYINIGELTGEPDNIMTEDFLINSSLIRQFEKNFNSGPLVENKYLDDNYLLLKLLCEISGYDILQNHIKKWEDSIYLVDPEWFNQMPVNTLIDKKLIFKNSDNCKYGKSNLFITKIEDNYTGFYDCWIEKEKSITSMVTGKNYDNFTENGWIFPTEEIKKNNFDFPYNPEVITDGKIFLLFLISSKDHSTIVYQSNSLWEWKYTNKIEDIKATDISVDSDKNNFFIYYIPYDNEQMINRAILDKSLKLSRIETIIEEKKYIKLKEISYQKYKDYKVIVSRTASPAREQFELYINCKDNEFKKLKDKPLSINTEINSELIDKNDRIKKSPGLFLLENNIYLIYTGYVSNNELPSSIYQSLISPEYMNDYISSLCKKH